MVANDAVPASSGTGLALRGPRGLSAPLLSEIRAVKRRYVPLCYRFQDLRLAYAELLAPRGKTDPRRRACAAGGSRSLWPLYGLVTDAAGVVCVTVLPHVAGGSAPSFFAARTESLPEAMVLCVEGEIDLSTAPLFSKAIAAAFRDSPRLIVDLAEVQYLDISAIHVLENASRVQGRRLVVVGSAPHVHRVLDILRLADVVPVADKVERALTYLRRE
jgi:anti-anti-sigma factor